MTLPEAVRLELGRLVDRWRTLPVDRASGMSGAVRGVLAGLEAETASAQGRAAHPVPDLGPAAAMDQLTVLLQDRFAAGGADAAAWAGRVAALREATWA